MSPGRGWLNWGSKRDIDQGDVVLRNDTNGALPTRRQCAE
jgi:hypothetical protein